MEKFVIQTILMILSKLYSKDLIEAVKNLITAQLSSDLSGDEKRAEVRRQLRLVEGSLLDTIKSIPNTAVNLIIEVVVNYLRVSGLITTSTFEVGKTEQSK